jgi:hypothetical protein
VYYLSFEYSLISFRIQIDTGNCEWLSRSSRKMTR